MKRNITLIVALGMLACGASGAIAGTHYVVSNLHQIKPAVRHELRGERGPRGFPGVAGAPAVASPPEVFYSEAQVLPADGSSVTVQVYCEGAGYVPVGGGYRADGAIVTTSEATAPQIWTIVAHRDPTFTGKTADVAGMVGCQR